MIEVVAAFLGLESEHLEHAGAHPWLRWTRAWQFHYGPNDFPLLGIGAFVTAESESATIVAMPIVEILAHGIALPDFPSFVETPSGSKFFGDHAKVVRVEIGGMAWIPYGWVAFPVVWHPCTKVEGDEKENEDEAEDKPTRRQRRARTDPRRSRSA